MADVAGYPHGTFSWADLMTTDGAGAKTFYASLFGWEPIDNPLPHGGVYTMLQQDGKDVTALSEMSTEQKEQGMPPVWNSYITVDDVDAITETVGGLGGSVMMPPFDVMSAGRMSVIQDPTGAVVSLWQAKDNIGAHIFNVPNSMVWNELATRDAEAAKTFYSGLLGWTMETDETGYTMWANNGRANGGMIQMNEQWGDVPPHWGIYFAVTDIEATIEKAQKLGGTIIIPPTSAGETGTFAKIQDPQGAIFTAMEMKQIDEPLSAG